MSLARRTISALSWSGGSNLARVAVLACRYVALARLLEVETFGVYALALALVELSLLPTKLGMEGAFLHRCPHTADERLAADVHFTLRLGLLAGWGALALPLAWLLTDGLLRSAIWVLLATQGATQLTQTARLVLVRRVQHQRLALLELGSAVATTAVALELAVGGAELGALLATNVCSCLLTVAVLHGWRPPWRPRLRWRAAGVRYYLTFGVRNFAAGAVHNLLRRLDNLWTAAVLGQGALGLYSRAYRLAEFPRQLVGNPFLRVLPAAYAELKDEPERMARAFRDSAGLVVRLGTLVAGLLAVTAPELVAVLLGPRWQAMVPALQVLALFALLDPLEQLTAGLLVALGEPGRLARCRLLQLGVLGAGLLLGGRTGIVGVAVAVSGAAAIGMAAQLRGAQRSLGRGCWPSWGAPALSVLLALGAVAAVGAWLPALPAARVALKGGVYLAAFAGGSLLLDRAQLRLLRQRLGLASGGTRVQL